MLAFTALLSLATYVFADETFTLTAQGANINSKVGVADSKLVLNDQAATFILQTPSGYLTANGQDVVLTPQGIETSSTTKSKDFGIEDGKLRSGPSIDKFDFYSCPDGTLANFQCSGGVAITLYTGDTTAPADTVTSSTAGPAATSPSTEVPTSYKYPGSTDGNTIYLSQQVATKEESSYKYPGSTDGNTIYSAQQLSTSSASSSSASPVTTAYSQNRTVTDLHSTLVTITSCSDHACSSKSTADVSTYQGGAAQAKLAAGAIAMAGALLL